MTKQLKGWLSPFPVLRAVVPSLRPVILNEPETGDEFVEEFKFWDIKDKDTINVINDQRGAPNALETARNLNKAILALYATFLSEDGKQVDYTGMANSPQFCEYKKAALRLRSIRLLDLSGTELKALFINIYNALVIDGYVRCGVPTTTYKRLAFYSTVSYVIGGYVFSLDDIEHGILRSNRKHPAFFIMNAQFKDKDPRKAFSIRPEEFDPRIHFALVCGAHSCPPIRVYTPENLERGLDLATKVFCEDKDNVQVDIRQEEVRLSKIFEWYMHDFARNKYELCCWVCNYLSGDAQRDMMLLLERWRSNQHGANVTFLPYDWATNAKPATPAKM